MIRYSVTLVLLLVTIAVLTACESGSSTTSSTSSPTMVHNRFELEYQLLDTFSDVFWCDPDFYPIAREGQEDDNAMEQFQVIRANQEEFSAILDRLGLPRKSVYTDDEKLAVYRQHKELMYAVQVNLSGSVYQFNLRIGQEEGQRVEGTITSSGDMKIRLQEPSINTCPICLSLGTLIDTPTGLIPVEQLNSGMTAWTVNEWGNRVPARIIQTIATPVPSCLPMISLNLNDGRTLTASYRHPTAESRVLGDYRVGDTLDGGIVTAIKQTNYEHGATYDFLPSGKTGLYWANGILLKSTLLREDEED